MTVDISPLQRAVARLEEGVAEFRADPSRTLSRDGLIQRFELTYDLVPKIVRRVLVARMPSPDEIEELTFPALLRTAYEQGLIGETWPVWLDFRKRRSITSHAYDEEQAKLVADAIPGFLEAVEELLRRLERANK